MTSLVQQKERINTASVFKCKLKFRKSRKTDGYVGFVHFDSDTRRVTGISNEDDNTPKMVCVLDAKLSKSIVPGKLYDVTLIKMKEKKGFVTIDAQIHKFPAVIETTYIPKSTYRIEVKYGNRRIIYDPLDGALASHRNKSAVCAILSRQEDIANREQVIQDFVEAANKLIVQFHNDGYYSGT